MKTITVFQTLLPFFDFPVEEEIRSKKKKSPKMRAEVNRYFTAVPAPELNAAPQVLPAMPTVSAALNRFEGSAADVIRKCSIKDIGCSIIQAAVTELRGLAKDCFWHSSGKHFSKNELAERKEALADLKSFFYGEGLVDVIDCYGLENLTAEIIQNGVDPIFEEIAEAVVH